jgi:hypothetical protein
VAKDEDPEPQEAGDEELDQTKQERLFNADSFVPFLASTWRLARVRFLTIFFAFLLGAAIAYSVSQVIQETLEPESPGTLIPFIVCQIVLIAILQGMLAAASAYLRIRAVLSHRVSILHGLRKVSDVWGHIGAAVLLTELLVTVVSFYAGFFAQLIGLPFRLGPPVLILVIALEKLRLGPAWMRTRALIKGNGLRIYTYLLMLGLLSFVPLITIQSLAGSAIVGEDEILSYTERLFYNGVGIFLFAIFDAVLAAGLVVTYVDLRKREDENFSLDELTDEPATDDAQS